MDIELALKVRNGFDKIYTYWFDKWKQFSDLFYFRIVMQLRQKANNIVLPIYVDDSLF